MIKPALKLGPAWGPPPVDPFAPDGRQEGGPVGEVVAVPGAVAMKEGGAGESVLRTGRRTAYRDHFLSGQLFGNDVVRAVEDPPFDDDIGAGLADIGFRELVGDDDIDLGRLPAEPVEARDQPFRREDRLHHDQQLLAAGIPARPQDRLADHLEGGLQAVPQALAVDGEAYPAALSFEDRDAEIALELLDMAADRAGRDR